MFFEEKTSVGLFENGFLLLFLWNQLVVMKVINSMWNLLHLKS